MKNENDVNQSSAYRERLEQKRLLEADLPITIDIGTRTTLIFRVFRSSTFPSLLSTTKHAVVYIQHISQPFGHFLSNRTFVVLPL